MEQMEWAWQMFPYYQTPSVYLVLLRQLPSPHPLPLLLHPNRQTNKQPVIATDHHIQNWFTCTWIITIQNVGQQNVNKRILHVFGKY